MTIYSKTLCNCLNFFALAIIGFLFFLEVAIPPIELPKEVDVKPVPIPQETIEVPQTDSIVTKSMLISNVVLPAPPVLENKTNVRDMDSDEIDLSSPMPRKKTPTLKKLLRVANKSNERFDKIKVNVPMLKPLEKKHREQTNGFDIGKLEITKNELVGGEIKKILNEGFSTNMKNVSAKTRVVQPFTDVKGKTEKYLAFERTNFLRGQKTLRDVKSSGGIDMEIFWPSDSKKAGILYDVLTRCFGMKSGVLDSDGELFLINGKSHGKIGKFSPLLRQLKKPANKAEAYQIQKIVRSHSIENGYQPIRIFRKIVDAKLLDGIIQIIGKPISSTSVIRAEYQVEKNRVYIRNIARNGVVFPGRIFLAGGSCSPQAS